MEIKTFRAKTMRDALELVRRELGPRRPCCTRAS